MCYSIYAWHGIVMNEMIPPEPSHLADTFRVLAPYLFITLALTALSALSYRYIEFGRERNWRAVFLIPVRAKAAVWSQLYAEARSNRPTRRRASRHIPFV